MTADLASGVYGQTSPLPAKMGFVKRGRGESSVVRINEGTSPPPTTRQKSPEVSFIFFLPFIVPTQTSYRTSSPHATYSSRRLFPLFLTPAWLFSRRGRSEWCSSSSPSSLLPVSPDDPPAGSLPLSCRYPYAVHATAFRPIRAITSSHRTTSATEYEREETEERN